MELSEHKIILHGEKVTLRPMTEGDDIEAYSLKQIQEIYHHISKNAVCFIIEFDGNPIGECWLQQMNLDRILRKYPGLDCRRIDLMIGEKVFWGQGLCTEVIRLLTSFAFEQAGADLVFGCDIADYNLASRRAFQKIGYQIDAEIPQPPNSKARYRYDLVIKREMGFVDQ